MYGNSMDFYKKIIIIRIFSIDVGLVWDWLKLPYQSFAWQSSHTIPIAHIIPIYGNGMDFYEIHIFPIDMTIERQYVALYGFNMVGNVPYQNHMKSIYGS